MKTNYTDANWVTERPMNNTINITAGKQGFVIAQVTSDCITHFIGNTEEAAANARLIAAAPKLLKCLQKVLDEVAPHIYKMPVKKVYSELITLNEATKLIHDIL